MLTVMAPGEMITRECLCCRRKFFHGIEYQVLGREPKYCRNCGEHHQQLALVPKTRKPRQRKASAKA
jgi:hypothetical protein